MDSQQELKRHTEDVNPVMFTQISAVISKTLYLEGRSKYGSSLCKHKTLCLHDLLEPYVWNELKFYLGGGQAEGTHTPWSDSDGMNVLPNVTAYDAHVIYRRENATESIVEMDTSQCHPGFTRLILVNCLDSADDLFSFIMGKGDGVLQANEDGTAFISSQKFAECFVSLHEENIKDIPTTHYRHGPCAAAVHHSQEYALRDLETDTAHALRCHDWPSGAQEWYTRERLHGWPPEKVIQCIRQQDCHVVPVGDQTSDCSFEEWRISFLLGERELVWSFNDTQLQCYYILKCLLKLELDEVAPGQLSSYHMKTIMFWQCERSPKSTWIPANLLQRVQTCLIEVKKAIEKRQLGHFFDKRINLMSTKFREKSDRVAMISKINSLLKDMINSVVQVVREKQFLDAWNHSQNLTTFVMIAECMDVPQRMAEADFILLCNMLNSCYLSASYTIRYPHIGLLIKNIDANVQAGRLDPKHTKCFKHFLEIKTGMELSILEKKIKDQSEKISMMKDAEDFFNTGSEFNAITGKLYLATFLFHRGDIQAMASVLGEAMKPLTDKPFYYAGLWSTKGVRVDKTGFIKQTASTSYTKGSDPFDGAMFDVVFTSRDTPVLPYVLKFESVLQANKTNDFFWLHPVVYYYLLTFLCEMSIGNYFKAIKSLLNLEKTVKAYEHPVRSFRNFNLLGYCFSMIGEYCEALECYQNSLQKYPNTTNAAVYHVLILMQFVLNSKQTAI